jgi:hypothetical protein
MMSRIYRDPFSLQSAIAIFLICWLQQHSVVVEATISILDSGVTYESRPDHKVGQRLWKGYEYMGRMQHIIENPTLCPQDFPPDKKFHIKQPSDGLPGK